MGWFSTNNKSSFIAILFFIQCSNKIDTISDADGNNQAGNCENAWGIDQRGYVMPHKGAVDGNMLRPYEWNLYGSQAEGSTPFFPHSSLYFADFSSSSARSSVEARNFLLLSILT